MSGLVALSLFTFLVNLPFGYFRGRSRRFSLRWFLCIHVPVLVIFGARVFLDAELQVIPLLIVAAFAGQLIGGRL